MPLDLKMKNLRMAHELTTTIHPAQCEIWNWLANTEPPQYRQKFNHNAFLSALMFVFYNLWERCDRVKLLYIRLQILYLSNYN